MALHGVSASVHSGGGASDRARARVNKFTLCLASDACGLNYHAFCDTLELMSTATSDLNCNRVKIEQGDLLLKCVFFIQHYPQKATTMSEINYGRRSSSEIRIRISVGQELNAFSFVKCKKNRG